MNNKVKIQGNKVKMLEDFWNNDQMVVLILLLIIKHSTNGTTLSVPLKKIAFVLDALKKNTPISKLSTLLASPWEITDDLRKKLILAYEKDYVEIKEVKTLVSFSLSELGNKIVSELFELNMVPELNDQIKNLSEGVKLSELKSQDLIW
ncbi:hypothetical protein [Pedobacter sp.]